MLEVDSLVKNYRGFTLGPVSLELRPGSASALIGANGAGKTTLFRCLIGCVRADEGEVRFDGQAAGGAAAGWRQEVGYVGDYSPFLNALSGADNLRVRSRFYKGWSAQRANEFASRLQLDLGQRVNRYSTGQRTKLALVSALAHSPRLLLLDEPAAGLDPMGQEILQDLLFEVLERDDVALLYATHHVSEVDRLADRLLFMQQGKIVRDEIKEDLLENWRGISFRSDRRLDNIPHALSHRVALPDQQLISDDYEATVKFLETEGVEAMEVSRLSTEQIAVRILRRASEERSHV